MGLPPPPPFSICQPCSQWQRAADYRLQHHLPMAAAAAEAEAEEVPHLAEAVVEEVPLVQVDSPPAAEEVVAAGPWQPRGVHTPTPSASEARAGLPMPVLVVPHEPSAPDLPIWSLAWAADA